MRGLMFMWERSGRVMDGERDDWKKRVAILGLWGGEVRGVGWANWGEEDNKKSFNAATAVSNPVPKPNHLASPQPRTT